MGGDKGNVPNIISGEEAHYAADLHHEVATATGSTLRPPPLSGPEMRGIHFKIKS